MTTAEVTPKTLRAAITEARADLQRAILEAAIAGAWDNAPAASADGEESWSPRQHAQHILRSELQYAGAVSQACGYPMVDAPEADLPTPADAAAEAVRRFARVDDIIRHVQAHELEKTFQMRSGARSVQQILESTARHLREHAEAIRRLSSPAA